MPMPDFATLFSSPLAFAVMFAGIAIGGFARGYSGFGMSALVVASWSLVADPAVAVAVVIHAGDRGQRRAGGVGVAGRAVEAGRAAADRRRRRHAARRRAARLHAARSAATGHRHLRAGRQPADAEGLQLQAARRAGRHRRRSARPRAWRTARWPWAACRWRCSWLPTATRPSTCGRRPSAISSCST